MRKKKRTGQSSTFRQSLSPARREEPITFQADNRIVHECRCSFVLLHSKILADYPAVGYCRMDHAPQKSVLYSIAVFVFFSIFIPTRTNIYANIVKTVFPYHFIQARRFSRSKTLSDPLKSFSRISRMWFRTMTILHVRPRYGPTL